MRDMRTNGEYKSLTKFDLNDRDSFTIVVANAAQWKRRAQEVISAFENGASFRNAAETHFDVIIWD